MANIEGFEVEVASGSLRAGTHDVVAFAHRFTEAGVTVRADFTGAHLLHVSVAGCVLNDVYREADGLGIAVHGVRVTARGGFDDETWASTGIEYDVEIDCEHERRSELLERVDGVAEIPKAIRQGGEVRRRPR